MSSHPISKSILAQNGLLQAETRKDNTGRYIDTVTEASGTKSYQCAMCLYSHPQQWKVANHIRSFHTMKKTFHCQTCTFVTERKVEFYLHKKQCLEQNAKKTEDNRGE